MRCKRSSYLGVRLNAQSCAPRWRPKGREEHLEALHEAHTAYAKYYNAKYGFTGHVWESRPYISAMDESHMWNAIRYVERNPVRAGIVARAEEYLWSSAAAHCGLRDDILLSAEFPPEGVISDWSEWLRIDHSEEERRAIRNHLKTGLPLCSPQSLPELEAITGQNLHPQKRGRPRKNPSLTSNFLFSENKNY
jgi:putative transposase